MHKGFWVYILASKRNGTIYIGVTDNMARRLWEHEQGIGSAFTKAHAVKTLVYAEHHQFWENAYQRESQLKKWRREWKIALIETYNPDWLPININL